MPRCNFLFFGHNRLARCHAPSGAPLMQLASCNGYCDMSEARRSRAAGLSGQVCPAISDAVQPNTGRQLAEMPVAFHHCRVIHISSPNPHARLHGAPILSRGRVVTSRLLPGRVSWLGATRTSVRPRCSLRESGARYHRHMGKGSGVADEMCSVARAKPHGIRLRFAWPRQLSCSPPSALAAWHPNK